MNFAEKLQELRRGAGMSQEELAEKLSVTRQAVSKWESGTALPEPNKLAALSRIFSVSINRLLQIDEPEGESGQEPPVMTEEQLAAVIERLGGWKNEQGRHRPQLVAVSYLIIIAVLLALFWLTTGSRFSAMERRIENLQGQLASVDSYVSSRIGALESSINDSFLKASSLVADYRSEVMLVDPTKNVMDIFVSISPKSVTEDTAVFVIFEPVDAESATVPCEKGAGNSYSATAAVTLSDEVRVSLLIDSGIERQTELLEIIYGVRSKSVLEVKVYECSGFTATRFSGQESWKAAIKGRTALEIFLPPRISHSRPQETFPTALWLELYVNGVLERKIEPDRQPSFDGLFTPGTSTSLPEVYELVSDTYYFQTDCEYELSPGDRIDLLAVVIDSFDITYTKQVAGIEISPDGEVVHNNGLRSGDTTFTYPD